MEDEIFLEARMPRDIFELSEENIDVIFIYS